MQMPAGAKLADVVKALNALGATPQDLLAILQAMKSRRRAERRDRGDLTEPSPLPATPTAWPIDAPLARRAAQRARAARPEGGGRARRPSSSRRCSCRS